MTTRFEIGSRVVCPDPTGRWFVGTVTHVHTCGDLRVSYGAGCFRVSAGEVRPVMPRDQADIDKYGRYWWRGDRIGGFGLNREYFFYDNTFDRVDPSDDWRGPVQPPPEVRS